LTETALEIGRGNRRTRLLRGSSKLAYLAKISPAQIIGRYARTQFSPFYPFWVCLVGNNVGNGLLGKKKRPSLGP
jgi:hypothetical protein